MLRLVGLVLLLCVQETSSTVTSDQQCTSSNTAGKNPNTGTHTEGPDNNLAFSYVAESHDYDFECCGVVTAWKVITGNVGTLQFQVWRRMSTTDYRLIGENYCAITSTGIKTCDVDTEDQIVVQKGDFIGWHNEGSEMVMYISAHFTDNSLNNMFRRKNVGDLSPGASENWSEVESYNDRNYGIRATYVAMTAPVITASSASVTVPDTMFSGGHIANIDYSDVDTMDNSSLTVIEDKKTVQITTTIASGYIAAANSYRLRDVTLKYTVMDTCWFTATATIAVTVQPTLVTIDSLDATFTVSEAITAQTYLYTLTATDPVDQWYCYSTWTASSAFPFMLKALTTTTYGIYVTESPSFDYDSAASPYLTLGVKCLENRVASTATVAENIKVYLTRNQPPVLTNLDATVTFDANTGFIGDTVYTVSATDPDGDILTYAMTCTPAATTHLTMMKNGQVQMKDWLLTSGPNYYYDCSVTVTDSDSNTDVGNLQISISNIDDQVEILNMPPDRIQIQENTPLGTSIYRFRYDDRDTDTKTWSITTHDTAEFSRFFNIDPDTGTLTTAFSLINREGLAFDFNHILSITVGDVQSSDTENMDIKIINENEAPYFTRDNFHLEVDEAADGTTVTAGTFFTFADEDLAIPGQNEEHTFELDCDTSTQTQRFSIDTTTADLTYEGPMDLDYSGTPTDYACIITIRDKYGLSDTANVFIHVKNVNEFTPQFTSVAYTVYVSSNTLVGTQLLVVTAVDYDLDSGDELDSDITYTLDQSAFGSTYFAIKEDGSIYLAGTLPTASMGTTLGVLLAQASNYNEAARTGSTSVTIVIPGSTTTVPVTTDRTKDFYEEEMNYFWLLLTLLGLIMMIMAIILVSFRLCRLTRIGVWCKVWCMKGICCRPKPEGPRGFGDMGYDLARFGHRHRYADEDDAVDGWLRRARRTHNNSDTFSDIPASPTPLLVDSQGRIGTPVGSYSNAVDVHNTPIYEMFRVPSPGRAVTGDEALDPLTSTRRKPIYVETWKDRKKQPIMKPASSHRWGP